MEMEPFEYLEHTSDIKFRSYGRTLEEAFSNAARALFNSMIDLNDIDIELEEEIVVEGEDLEFLLYNWLSELFYIFDAERKIFSEFDVKIRDRERGYSLIGNARGEEIKEKHIFDTGIKAVTLHDIFVERSDSGDGYICQVVLDV
jgi:SHS2 domain-containing protein